MDRVDTLEWSGQGDVAPVRRRTADDGRSDPSPFFWWVRALLAAGGAIALFPVVFAVAIKVIDLSA